MVSTAVVAQESGNNIANSQFGSSVQSDVIGKSSETNVNNALYGQLAGLYVMQNTNTTNVLDTEATFYVRGNSTLNSTTPLILIDGIERDQSNIAISEVAKVEVLKDAVASAIYGVKGANGVILITTKRGSDGFRANVSYSTSFDTAFRTPEFVDAATYVTLMNQALEYEGSDPYFSDNEVAAYVNGTNREVYPDIDWQDAAYRTFGRTHLANVEFEGGGERVKYYANLDYSNVIGLFNNSDLTDLYNSQLNKVNINLLSNVDVKLTSTTDLSVGVLGRIQEQKRPGVGMSTIMSRLYNTPSSAFPIKTGTENWGSTSLYGYNPIADIADTGTVKAIRRTLFANMELVQNLEALTDGLYAKVRIAHDNSINYNDQRTRSYQYEVLTPEWHGDELYGVERTIYGTQSELGWSSSLNDSEMATSILGAVGYDREIGKQVFNTQLAYELVSQLRDGQNSSRKRASIMAVADYSYDNRYYANAVLNYSGTAVLEDGSQYEIFPAIALGWVASNESFLKKSEYVDFLKLRTSFGLSGCDLFTHDLFLQTYGVSGSSYYFGDGNTTYSGLKNGDLPTDDLAVELSRKFDFGVDVTLMKSINLSATYFYENRSRIRVSSDESVSAVLGATTPQLCQGEVSNQGIELALGYSGKVKDFGYNLTGNFTYAKNKIINNNEGYKPNDYLYTEGNSIDQYYGLQSAGFFSSQEDIDSWGAEQSFGDVMPGDVKYVDQNGDKIVDENDVIRLGYSAVPEIYYGFNLNLFYRGLSLFAQFQGVAHRNIYLNTTSVNVPLVENTNISKWYVEDNVAWTPETASTATLPRLTTVTNENNYRKSDLWMANGNFFKLRNLELSYTFEESMLKYVGLRLFVRGANLFSLDQLGYADPENYGVAYPTMRSYTIGANLTF